MRVKEDKYLRLTEDEVYMLDFINSSLVDPQTHKVLVNGLIQSAFSSAIYNLYTEEEIDWVGDKEVEDLLTFIDDDTLLKQHTIERIEKFKND